MKPDAAKARSKPVVLVSGREDFLRMRFLAELLDRSAADEDDFDAETFTADAKPFDEWVASAGTTPFLSDRRTVVVRNLLRSDLADESPTKVVDSLKRLPETALLVLVADDESGDDNRQKRFATLRKTWESAVTKAGGAVCSFDVEGKELRSLIRTEVQSRGKTISLKAIEELVERCASNASAALKEIDKLVVFTHGETEIREADVIAAVSPSYEWNVFRMIDAALGGKPAEAQKQLRILVGSSSKAEDAALRNIFPVLSKQLKLIWQARLCVEAGCSIENPPQSVLDQFPAKPSLRSEPDWSRERVMRRAQSLTIDQLRRGFEALSDVDAKLKGLAPSFSAMDSLEQFLLQVAAISGQARPMARL